MKQVQAMVFGALLALTGAGHAAVVDELQAGYRTSGAGPFNAAAGKQLWFDSNDHAGEARGCTRCHGDTPKAAGRHASTGKPIEPMAPSMTPARLTDAAKVEKWFKRNCNWTLGRECSAQEKGDVLEFLRGQ